MFYFVRGLSRSVWSKRKDLALPAVLLAELHVVMRKTWIFLEWMFYIKQMNQNIMANKPSMKAHIVFFSFLFYI